MKEELQQRYFNQKLNKWVAFVAVWFVVLFCLFSIVRAEVVPSQPVLPASQSVVENTGVAPTGTMPQVMTVTYQKVTSNGGSHSSCVLTTSGWYCSDYARDVLVHGTVAQKVATLQRQLVVLQDRLAELNASH